MAGPAGGAAAPGGCTAGQRAGGCRAAARSHAIAEDLQAGLAPLLQLLVASQEQQVQLSQTLAAFAGGHGSR